MALNLNSGFIGVKLVENYLPATNYNKSVDQISAEIYEQNKTKPIVNVKRPVSTNESQKSIVDSIKKWVSNIIKSCEKFIKGKERYQIEKSLKRIVHNDYIKEMLRSHQPKDTEAFTDIIPSISKLAVATLKNQDSAQISIKNSQEKQAFLFLKNSDGKIEVIIKTALLGKGGAGDVFRAVSLTKQKECVLKYALDDKLAKQDLKFECRNLELLNHPGIQKKIRIAHIKGKSVHEVIAKGKVYTGGDLFKPVFIKKLAIVLNIAVQDLAKMTKNELKSRLDRLRNKNEEDVIVEAVNTLLGANRVQDFFQKSTRDALLLDLAEACLKMNPININTKMQMGANLVSGLLHIHQQGMIHVDIKPSNFLFDGTLAVIADFGAARLKSDPIADKSTPPLTPQYCTQDYAIAMKQYNKNKDSENWFLAGKAYDHRGMGLSLYEIITGQKIPNENADDAAYDKMQRHLINEGIPKAAADILVKMCRPIAIDLKNLPNPFPTVVTDDDLQILVNLLTVIT